MDCCILVRYSDTDAQKRALEWLPSDGSWRLNPGRLGAALSSLALQHSGLVKSEFGYFGPRGGRALRWRLTSDGVRAKHTRSELSNPPVMNALESDLFAFLCRKYVQRADELQKAMGLQYTEAETHDLAKMIANFIDARERTRRWPT